MQMKISGSLGRKIGLLLVLLLLAGTLMHLFIRSSEPFTQVSEAYMRSYQLPSEPKVGLCYFCAQSVSFAGGGSRYRFVIHVNVDSRVSEVLVTAQSGSDGKYVYTFEPID